MKVISEQQFRERLVEMLYEQHGNFNLVTGPGRSGAIAAVYASHYLSIPFIPPTHSTEFPRVLVIDTAISSGETLRKLARKHIRSTQMACFNEPPRVKFWYEVWE